MCKGDFPKKEKNGAKTRPLHVDSKGKDKYALFNANTWINKGGAKKKNKRKIQVGLF